MAFEPVGEWEIAELLKVKRGTAKQWTFRGILPEPVAFVNGKPCWPRSLILRWAKKTGRLPSAPTKRSK